MKFLYFLFLAGTLSTESYGQQAAFSEGYYVIVGTFAVKENAEKFNNALHTKQMKSEYGYLPSRKLYYVYTLSDADVTRCMEVAKELRKDQQFSDAWVRYINEKLPAGLEPPNPQEVVAHREEQVPSAENIAQPAETTQLSTPAEEIKDNEEIVQYDKVTLGNTEVFLSLFNARNDKVAEGDVQVVDAERGRMIREVKGNSYLILPDPKSTTGKLSLICDVVGYRKMQKDLDFNNPLTDSSVVEQMGTTLVVNFDLARYQKGDIRVLFNIYFFNDAAVMMPESKYELNGLLDMMQENPNYRIKLHGHTNGNASGKIIRRGSTGDFFSVSKDASTTIGTAKELSESRAEVIRDYLIEKGVDASRVEVKAWGGKRPIYNKHSANAKKNIRVEVEILND
jgi:outer membrane protein OmpA-like peptidoglycan-associated protein